MKQPKTPSILWFYLALTLVLFPFSLRAVGTDPVYPKQYAICVKECLYARQYILRTSDAFDCTQRFDDSDDSSELIRYIKRFCILVSVPLQGSII